MFKHQPPGPAQDRYLLLRQLLRETFEGKLGHRQPTSPQDHSLFFPAHRKFRPLNLVFSGSPETDCIDPLIRGGQWSFRRECMQCQRNRRWNFFCARVAALSPSEERKSHSGSFYLRNGGQIRQTAICFGILPETLADMRAVLEEGRIIDSLHRHPVAKEARHHWGTGCAFSGRSTPRPQVRPFPHLPVLACRPNSANGRRRAGPVHFSRDRRFIRCVTKL